MKYFWCLLILTFFGIKLVCSHPGSYYGQTRYIQKNRTHAPKSKTAFLHETDLQSFISQYHMFMSNLKKRMAEFINGEILQYQFIFVRLGLQYPLQYGILVNLIRKLTNQLTQRLPKYFPRTLPVLYDSKDLDIEETLYLLGRAFHHGKSCMIVLVDAMVEAFKKLMNLGGPNVSRRGLVLGMPPDILNMFLDDPKVGNYLKLYVHNLNKVYTFLINKISETVQYLNQMSLLFGNQNLNKQMVQAILKQQGPRFKQKYVLIIRKATANYYTGFEEKVKLFTDMGKKKLS